MSSRTSRPPGSGGAPRPERRRRGDIVAAALLALLLVVGAAVMWRSSAVAGTTSQVATTPVAAPPPWSGAAPAVFTEAWHAPSAATPTPVVAGDAVVTADSSTVAGRDARTGAEAWSYHRDLPLCTVGAGFPSLDDGLGRVIALYEGHTGWCSELTMLRPDTGARAGARNPDLRPGTRLLENGTFLAATGSDYLEVLRYDLVLTLEYGTLPTPVQLNQQPRPGCHYGSTALTTARLGVIERCPGETTDRLTVLSPDGKDGAEKPQVQFSVPLPAAGATLVALSAERAAVALPGPARLLLLDKEGHEISTVPLDVPESDLAGDPPGGVPAIETDGERVYWWSGSRTLAFDATDLTPRWSRATALGPAVPYGTSVLVPVPGGLDVLDPASGTVERTIPVTRSEPGAPVRLATLGEVLLEHRGSETAGLLPSG